MNTKRHARGSVLIASVMILTGTLIVGLGATLRWTLSGYRGAVNRTERTRMLYAADSGAEYALAWLRTYTRAFQTHPHSADYARITAEFAEIVSNEFPRDMRLAKFDFIESAAYQVNSVTDSLYRGARASIKPIQVRVGFELVDDTSTYVEVCETIEARSFSIFEYGVFVDGDLMINSDKKMRIMGAVHANGVLRLGTRAAADGLVLGSYVTSASNIYNCSQPTKTTINYDDDGSGHSMTDYLGYKLDSDHPYWKVLSTMIWRGRVMSWEHGMPRLMLPLPYAQSNPRILIEPPHPSDNEFVAEARYANRAALRIMGDNIQRFNPSTSNFTTIAQVGSSSVNSWLSTNKYFWNNTINGFVTPMDIDVGAFRTWAQANAPVFYNDEARAGVLYISISNKPGTAVRLTNGASLPNPIIAGVTNGFTVVTENPLYLLGHYNSYTECPACVISDSLTVLSSNWDDDEHLVVDSPRGSVKNTRYLTSMITGQATNINTFTAESWFGGIEDLPKYIEDWKGTGASGNKEIRGTICSIWPSKYELTNLVDPDAGPNRLWWYDSTFAYPPGAPRFHEFVPDEWARSATR
ncbi:hypothetical protein GX586_06820 [bacterium]|nr:hypothetical protein [bacterium]